jgi:hypothetical protein
VNDQVLGNLGRNPTVLFNSQAPVSVSEVTRNVQPSFAPCVGKWTEERLVEVFAKYRLHDNADCSDLQAMSPTIRQQLLSELNGHLPEIVDELVGVETLDFLKSAEESVERDVGTLGRNAEGHTNGSDANDNVIATNLAANRGRNNDVNNNSGNNTSSSESVQKVKESLQKQSLRLYENSSVDSNQLVLVRGVVSSGNDVAHFREMTHSSGLLLIEVVDGG